ncbi:MAG: hypothetical protein O6944_10040, partial [Gammaproteobacteria bacterium]|nr:hypothetical protein [Gammaproteobacteria bacterium]
MDQSVWALQSRYMAYHGHNIFALNLPGHGRYAEHKTKESSGTGFKVAPKHLDKHWISATTAGKPFDKHWISATTAGKPFDLSQPSVV